MLQKVVRNMSELHKTCMRPLEMSIERSVWYLIVFGTISSQNLHLQIQGWSIENATPIITTLVTVIPEIHI